MGAPDPSSRSAILSALPGRDLARGAAYEPAPPPASEPDMLALDLPGNLRPDWRRAWLDAFGQALRRFRFFELYMQSCTRCGACAQVCPYYICSGDPKNMPMMRAELARSMYRDFFKSGGTRSRVDHKRLSRQDLLEWYVYFHQCSLCRRCASVCPLHIDTAQITILCRSMLAQLGLAPASTVGQALSIYRQGNAWGLDPQAWQGLAAGVEAELKRQTGQDIRCPVDTPRADILLIPDDKDLMSYAKIFHAAGMSWTTSTYINQAYNPGLYLGYKHLRSLGSRVLEAARELKPRLVIWAESGSGWVLARNLMETLTGTWQGEDYLEVKRPLSFMDWGALMLDRGAFQGRLQKEVHDDKVLTLHDPCFAARWAGQLKEPRELLRACCHFFQETPVKLSGVNTQCCGGGGGLRGPEFSRLRAAAFGDKAVTLMAMQKLHGVNWVASPCPQCRSSIQEGCQNLGLELNAISVAELFSQALYPAPDREP